MYELQDYFPMNDAKRKNAAAMRTLQERYEHIDSPIAKKIGELLFATNNFFAATDSNFQLSRDNIPATIIVDKLNRMANAFTTIIAYRAEINADRNEYKIITNAIEYCRESVKNRIQELEKIDRFYIVYKQNDNALKKMLEQE